MAENKGYAHPEVLVDAGWVEDHLHDPKVRLIEVDVDTTAYEQGHIPGAVGFNWQKELQDQVIRAPLSQAQLEDLLSSAGVSNDTTIVLYGDNNNWFAAWALWILKYYGHPDVRLLDGGRVKWLADKRELTTEVPSYPRTHYHAQAPEHNIRALRDQIFSSSVSRASRWWMCALLLNTAASYWRPQISRRRELSAAAIFLARPTSPGRWRCARMARSSRLTNCARFT